VVDGRLTLRCNCEDAVRLDVFVFIARDGSIRSGLTGGTMRRFRQAQARPGKAPFPYIDKLMWARAGTGQLSPTEVGPDAQHVYDCGKCHQHWEWRYETLVAAVAETRRAGRREIVAGEDL
jgi:hypothetical protein